VSSRTNYNRSEPLRGTIVSEVVCGLGERLGRGRHSVRGFEKIDRDLTMTMNEMADEHRANLCYYHVHRGSQPPNHLCVLSTSHTVTDPQSTHSASVRCARLMCHQHYTNTSK
jgi:hypothetical protein